jgi:hypothetical protein
MKAKEQQVRSRQIAELRRGQENAIMGDRWLRVRRYVIYCIAFCTLACSAQKQTVKQDWATNNAMIGPDSPIEVRAGSTYHARAMYPVPDGPLFPLKQKVAWSIEPAVKGISIDAVGNITVAADVPHGTTAIVHADIERGRRKLLEKIFVYRTEENPLIGEWRLDTRVTCGEAHEVKKAPASSFLYRNLSWKFHVSQQFWLGKEHNIAGGVHLAGSYELDLKDSKIKLIPTWPKKPPSNWSYLLKDGETTLILQPLDPQDDLEPGCGYILVR